MRSCVPLDGGETYRPIHRPNAGQNPDEIQNSRLYVRTTTDNGANFVSSFKLFGQQTIQVLDEHHPEEDAIREELQSMSQQAVQDVFVLNVNDAFPMTVDDEPAAEPIQLHDALEEEDEVHLRYNLPKHLPDVPPTP